MLIIGLISILLAKSLNSLKITPILLIRVTSLILLYSIAISNNVLYVETIGSGIGIFNDTISITLINQTFEIIIYLLASLIILPWGKIKIYRKYKNYSSILPTIHEYSLIILFSVLGSIFLICASDLITMYLSLELQSFSVYILTSIYKNKESATYSGLKYFLLGGLASAFILLGIGIIYTTTGITNIFSIYSIINIDYINGIENINIDKSILLGYIMITFGLLFKIGAVPFHNWAPDVYNGVPTIITIWLIIIPKLAIFLFLIELINSYINIYIFNIWFNLILIIAFLSLLIGTIVGLSQDKIKRLLAYSSISHIGFILLALGVYNESSIEAYLFYILQYSLTSLSIFYILLGLGYSFISKDEENINEDIIYIKELTGQYKYNPFLSISLAICLFSMSGIPPLIGFFGKLMVLYSSLQKGYIFLTLIAIISSVISSAYYLRIIKVMFFDKIENIKVKKEKYKYSRKINYLSNSQSFIISILTLIILLFILKPNLILNIIHIITLSIFQ